MVDMGARWYGTSSVFVSRDSYGGAAARPVTLNRSAYANNNPTRFFDPDGLMSADASARNAAVKAAAKAKAAAAEAARQDAARLTALRETNARAAAAKAATQDAARAAAIRDANARAAAALAVTQAAAQDAARATALRDEAGRASTAVLTPRISKPASPPGPTIVTADAAEHRAASGPQGSCFVSGAHFSGTTLSPTMTCPNSRVPDPLGSLYGEDRVTASEIISLAKNMVPTAGGYCSSIGIALFVVGFDLSGCIVQTETNAGVLLTASVGGGFLPPDAHIGAGSMLSNASNMKQLKGESACVGGSADFGFGANVAVCAGLRDDGGFSGIVSITGLVTASTTPIPSIGLFLTYSTTGEFSSTPPKNYRNPDGSCTSGNSADRCGQGSMNNGVPGGFP